MQITIDETTARMAVIAMRERAENKRRECKLRGNGGTAYASVRASLRSQARVLDERADALEATYARKARSA